MMPFFYVRCHKVSSRDCIFTDGKLYEGWKETDYGKVVYIKDDHGTVRAVIPDGTPCSHMLVMYGGMTQPSLSGYWTLEDNPREETP